MSSRKPREPERIVSRVCGHARIVKVGNDFDRRQAAGIQCRDCRLEVSSERMKGEPFEPPEKVPCPVCGQERKVVTGRPSLVMAALKRPCRPCAARIRSLKYAEARNAG